MPSTVTLRTGVFVAILTTTALLALAFLLGVIPVANGTYGDKETSYDFSRLEELLKSGKFGAALLVDENAEVAVLTPQGGRIPPCGFLEGTKVVDNEKLEQDAQCNLQKIAVTHVNNVGLAIIKRNPRCTLIRAGNKFYMVHAGGDGYPAGYIPCHDGTNHRPF